MTIQKHEKEYFHIRKRTLLILLTLLFYIIIGIGIIMFLSKIFIILQSAACISDADAVWIAWYIIISFSSMFAVYMYLIINHLAIIDNGDKK